MVFVDGVVTVQRIAARHVAKPDENLDLIDEPQLYNALARELDVSGPDRHAVAAEDAEFHGVDVDRMLPVAGVVLDDPPLRGVGMRREAETRCSP